MRTFIFIAALFLHSSCSSQPLKGRVVNVADGDTFTMLLADKTTRKIRLYGVDCPERGQDFGNVAKRFTMQRCEGLTVTVIPKSKDPYRRTVGLVLLGKDTLNVLLLKAGMAWHFDRYDKNPVWERYEEEARKAKRGLWVAKNAMPPQEWRKSRQRKPATNYDLKREQAAIRAQ